MEYNREHSARAALKYSAQRWSNKAAAFSYFVEQKLTDVMDLSNLIQRQDLAEQTEI